MRWAQNLYTTEKTKKKLPRIMRDFRKKKLQPSIWVITLASNPENLFDIFHGIHYVQPMFVKMNPDIVGVAESSEAAKELLKQMVEDIFQKTGDLNVRAYFEFQE